MSPSERDDVPGDQRDDADHHGEGVVVDVAGLQLAGAPGEIHSDLRDPVGAESVDDLPVAAFPKNAAQRLRRIDEDRIVELVEVPLVEDEGVDRADSFGEL